MSRLIFSSFFLLTALQLTAADPDFYVWQRQLGSQVEKAVKELCRESSGRIGFLAGEMENSGRIIQILPAGFIPAARSFPVFRIHINNMKHSPAELAEIIAKSSRAWHFCKALQIDLDCPENQLEYYADLMQELRKLLPGFTLSATVLPCHLGHEREFRQLARQCDCYVLQIHSLAQRADKSYFIMDRRISVNAVNSAEKIAHPYQVALPFYSHFIGGKAIFPDPELIAEIAGMVKKSSVATGVIAFRLQIDGEFDVLDFPSALALCRGEKHAPRLDTRWEIQENGAWKLFLANRGYFAQKVTLNCNWAKDFQIRDAGTFKHAVLSPDRRELTLYLPPPGTEMPLLWLRSNENHDLNKNNPLTLTVKENAKL